MKDLIVEAAAFASMPGASRATFSRQRLKRVILSTMVIDYEPSGLRIPRPHSSVGRDLRLPSANVTECTRCTERRLCGEGDTAHATQGASAVGGILATFRIPRGNLGRNGK